MTYKLNENTLSIKSGKFKQLLKKKIHKFLKFQTVWLFCCVQYRAWKKVLNRENLF